ncbi:uncharacterized protein EKO05_0006043 [Ascochyta rabiei]|uniref:N-acetylgalactosaminide beta-1,3-galactosyltransferase n=1 Tax=Didymella rabiei TaxID=5454 RepID=A0A163ICW8_DIDRA|nr:uncharacterized protein EKO05_0006043 [Ascochyta rabiei]KZM25707.1 transferase [Ascochyta rabiei]UPX15600.1 hypothetical protein EKO05_0006043 [Ascochyta rabiei]
MLAPLRRFLRSPNPIMIGHAIGASRSNPLSSRRWLRLLFTLAVVAVGINLFVLLDWTYVESLPRQVLGNQAFHPKPFAPAPHGLESQDENGLDYWTWATKTQFKKKENIDWNEGVMDECFLFPKHLLSKIQVVLKTGLADDWSRTDAQLSTMIKCIPNVLIVSDHNSTYGSRHHTVDVLADLPPSTYLKEEDYFVYVSQKNASRDGVQLHQGHEGWRIDKYKFLPQVEKAVEYNKAAEWFVFLETDTYFFWDNVFRLLENYDASLPYFFGSPSPGRKYRPSADSEDEEQVWFAFGGCGFILSTVAAHRLVDRPRNSFGVQGPRLTAEYEQDIRNDCCGDSILGWALHDKAAVGISGLWPMFNPHRLEDIPFGSQYWCEPVISLHKTDPVVYKELWSWENEQRLHSERPLLYTDLLFSFHGNFSQRENWDAAFDAGFQLPDNSTVHTSLDACEAGCFAHNECQQYTWHGRHCYYAEALYIGRAKQPDGYHDLEDRKYVSGWDTTKIQTRSIENQCTDGPHWVKPSVKRKY